MSDIQAEVGAYDPGTHPDLPPPPASTGVLGWIQQNLIPSFRDGAISFAAIVVVAILLYLVVGLSPLMALFISALLLGLINAVLKSAAPDYAIMGQTVLTVVAVVIIYWIAVALIEFVVTDAIWSAKDRADCQKAPDGACWGFVTARFAQFMYGFYPEVERWRVDLTGIILLAAGVPLLFPSMPKRNWFGLFLIFCYPLLSIWLLLGGFSLAPILILVALFVASAAASRLIDRRVGMTIFVAAILYFVVSLFAGIPYFVPWSLDALNPTYVETDKWGGLMLTLVVAITGIAASLPIGILLALGRRSNMPVVRTICIVFIEFWRGVPLVTVLFMASVMFPLFLPEGVTFNQLLRALIGVALFSAAYMAEVIRGGLQALPRGQYEAADALGLNYFKSMRLIILPQALKIVIPGIVNTFIGLFKDTTLVAIIGLVDFLNSVDAGMRDASWLAPNVPYTGYLFVAAVFWCFCYGMSRYSVAVERRLETGHKR